MKIHSFRVAASVFEGIAQAADFYENRDGEDAGNKAESYLFAALDKIKASNPEAANRPLGFPRNYRRYRAKPYVFFYRFNLSNADVLVYLMRHERQRPFAPTTHRHRAAEAETTSVDLSDELQPPHHRRDQRPQTWPDHIGGFDYLLVVGAAPIILGNRHVGDGAEA